MIGTIMPFVVLLAIVSVCFYPWVSHLLIERRLNKIENYLGRIEHRLIGIESDIEWLCEYYGDDPDPGEDNEEAKHNNVAAIGKRVA